MLRSPLSSRAALVAARLLAVAAVAATGLAVALPLVTGGDWLLQLFRTPEPVAAPAFAVTGALLIGLRPARRLGWLLLVIGCSAATYVLATSWWVAAGQTGPVGGLRSWSWVPALLLVTSVRMRAFFTAGAGVVAKPFPELSDREREVLDLIAAGMPNATIAAPVPVREDGAQLHHRDLRQARRARPRRGGRAGPRGRARPRHRPLRRPQPAGFPTGCDLVGKGGVEPPRPFGHTDLNRARLPFRHLPWREARVTVRNRIPGRG
jgi:hypothetical protein